jgi:hypothetical protein
LDSLRMSAHRPCALCNCPVVARKRQSCDGCDLQLVKTKGCPWPLASKHCPAIFSPLCASLGAPRTSVEIICCSDLTTQACVMAPPEELLKHIPGACRDTSCICADAEVQAKSVAICTMAACRTMLNRNLFISCLTGGGMMTDELLKICERHTSPRRVKGTHLFGGWCRPIASWHDPNMLKCVQIFPN